MLPRLARTIIVSAALGALVLVLVLMTLRQSLILAFIPTMGVGSVSVWRGTRWIPRRLAAVCLVNLVLAAVPIDLTVSRQDHGGVRVVRMLWGLPTSEGNEAIQRGEYWPAGCIIPPYPARSIVVVGIPPWHA